ncbi:hypothetical protein GW17_00048745, partial [Ensete ventricosum]
KSRASVVEGYVLDNGRQRGRHQGTENISCAGKSSAQEHPAATSSSPSATVYPEWSGFQKSVPAITDGDIKSSEGKERNSIQRLKGSLGSLNIIAGKNSNEPNKTSAAADRVLSQSDSGSDDSSEGSDAKSEDDLEQKPSGKQELLNGRHYKICT